MNTMYSTFALLRIQYMSENSKYWTEKKSEEKVKFDVKSPVVE